MGTDNRHIVVIAFQYSVVVKGIERKLADSGYRVTLLKEDFDRLEAYHRAENLKSGIRAMDRQLRGFALPDAVLTGPETRSSSPVRFCRTSLGEAEDILGLFPVGEGAGYAGGIVSAAADGISAALKVIEKKQLL